MISHGWVRGAYSRRDFMFESIQSKARAQDGCSLSYRIYPQPGKSRLVLIHSLALDSSMWDEVVTEFGGDVEILAYDCRGHGQSERKTGEYSARLFAYDLAAVLDHSEWASATIAGCSMGGCVAQAFAVEHPQRAEALALIDTTAWYGPDAPDEWRKRAEKAAETGFAAMLPFQLTRWFSDRFRTSHANKIEEVSRVFLANDLGCYQASCALLGNVDLRSSISSLQMPVSVIVGEDDFATPLSMAQEIHERIAGSTLRVIPGGRHLTPVECPEQIAVLLKHLVGTAERAGA